MMRTFLRSLRALLEGDRQECLEAIDRCLVHFQDPEPRFYMVRQLALLGETARALAELQSVERSERLEREMAETFVQSGADRLLGVAIPRTDNNVDIDGVP